MYPKKYYHVFINFLGNFNYLKFCLNLNMKFLCKDIKYIINIIKIDT